MTNTITSLPRTASEREQAVNRLMSEIAFGEASAEDGNWISESDILSEFKGRP